MPYRYTDTSTRLVWSKASGRFNTEGLTARFWYDEDGTGPVDLGAYDPDAPTTPGAPLGDNTLTVQADSMWPAVWDLGDGQDYVWIQVGTEDDPGDLYRIFCDPDQRLDAYDQRITAAEDVADQAQAAAASAETTSGSQAKADAAYEAARDRGNHTGTQSADTLTDGSTSKAFLATERTKLAGVATGATANSTDAQLRDRSTHTGTQAIGTVSGLQGALDGKADLVGGVIPTAQIPALTINDTFTVDSQAEMLALTAERGDIAVRTDFTPSHVFILADDDPSVLGNWKEITAAGSVTSINGQSGTVTLGATDVGAAPSTRTIQTTAPLSGGGDLSANRTLTVADATSGAKGVVQLAGDLAGTAAAPVIASSAVTADKTAPGLIGRLYSASSGNREVLANDPFFGTVGSRAAFINALNAAETLGQHTVVRIPAGVTIDVGTGLSLSGYSAQIRGDGAGAASPSGGNASVIKASTQTGPVLDFTGYVDPFSFRGRITPISGVTIVGSGVADATKANSGLKFRSLGSAYVHDVAIMSTGGPCVDMAQNTGDAVYLSTFERIIFTPPVSAGANDVPWFYGNECNGNIFRDFGFRAPSGTGFVGASGAVVLEGNATWRMYQSVLDSWWFENLHPANGGTLVSISANGTSFREPMFYDCTKESTSHTGTSFVRYLPSVTQDSGGNVYTGLVFGHETAAITIDTGIDIRQSWNTVIGPKGYRGNNVTLAAGVDHCTVWLTGSYGNSSILGWTDNSGMTNNRLIDDYMHVEVRPNNWKINSNTYSYGTGSPEGVLVGTVGDEYTRTDGFASATKYIKSKFTGTSTGWMPSVVENFGAGTVSTNQAIPFQTNTAWKFTLAANVTFTSISNARTGGVMVVMLAQDATGGRTVTWPSTVKWAGGVAPTLSTAAGKVDVFQFMFDGANWREMSRAIGT